MATQIDLGAVVPIGKGDWNPSTTYERANIVRHNSVAWICKVATSLGVEPTETSSDWYLLVKDTSSVTSINGMKGDVTIDSVLENPSIDDNSLKIASTAWTNTKISQDVANVMSAVNQVQSEINQVQSEIKVILPVGSVIASAMNATPDGYLICNGAEISRTTYAALFAVIGTTYGSGDGLSTFNLPNLINKFIQGSNKVGTEMKAGLPNINGSVLFRGGNNGGLAMSGSIPNNKGAFNVSGANTIFNASYTTIAKDSGQYLYIDASRSSSVYGNSTTVQPPALTMCYYIKY